LNLPHSTLTLNVVLPAELLQRTRCNRSHPDVSPRPALLLLVCWEASLQALRGAGLSVAYVETANPLSVATQTSSSVLKTSPTMSCLRLATAV